MASVVENVAVPIRVKALARVAMLIQVRSVEKRQTMLVRRKMGRDPIENDADASLVQVIDEKHEILRRPCRLVGAK